MGYENLSVDLYNLLSFHNCPQTRGSNIQCHVYIAVSYTYLYQMFVLATYTFTDIIKHRPWKQLFLDLNHNMTTIDTQVEELVSSKNKIHIHLINFSKIC